MTKLTLDEVLENLTKEERAVIEDALQLEREDAYRDGYEAGEDYGYSGGYDSGWEAGREE